MNPVPPIDPRVRLAISRWPDNAPRGAVSTFCAEHEISRTTFYKLRQRAREHGQASVLEPISRRPHTSPSRISDALIQQALDVRAALERSGLDYGPVSVHEKMKRMGITPPAEATLARIFRAAGVARYEPRKKPRAAYRRFVYPAPNACWQLDATEYVLTGGRTCVVFQLIDDHSRYEIASHVAASETADAALEVFQKGVAARGVPQRLLTDNGLALNPARRGWLGKLYIYARSLGVEMITGKPYKPTTQGKNERLHRTLFRWLDAHPLAETLAGLQSLVDRFDVIYNTERPHQALPGRITPQMAWEATPVADPPRPTPTTDPHREATAPATRRRKQLAEGEATRRVGKHGVITVLGVHFHVGRAYAETVVRIVWDLDTVAVFDERGTGLITYPRPAAGVRSVGNGKPAGFMAGQKVSTMS